MNISCSFLKGMGRRTLLSIANDVGIKSQGYTFWMVSYSIVPWDEWIARSDGRSVDRPSGHPNDGEWINGGCIMLGWVRMSWDGMVWNGIVVDCKTDWVSVSISNVLLLLLLGLECDMRNIYHILFFCFPLLFFCYFFWW